MFKKFFTILDLCACIITTLELSLLSFGFVCLCAYIITTLDFHSTGMFSLFIYFSDNSPGHVFWMLTDFFVTCKFAVNILVIMWCLVVIIYMCLKIMLCNFCFYNFINLCICSVMINAYLINCIRVFNIT